MNLLDDQVLPSCTDVRETHALLAGQVAHTPLVEFPVLNERVGGRVLLKLEIFQHMNSFKFRGAMSRMVRLNKDECRNGVVAWSSGNHAQAVAAAGLNLQIPTTIVMPEDAPAVKLARTRAQGATVVTYDRETESREEISYRLAEDQNLVVIPSFDDRWVIAGQGTAGLEVLEDCASRGIVPDDFLICCGGGGLTAGCALAMEAARWPMSIWTVEPEHFDDHKRSFMSGFREKVIAGSTSICDALLAPMPGELTFTINKPRVAGGYSVSDDQVREAMRFAFNELRIVTEPGGAAALAALLSGAHRCENRIVVTMISGGNVDPRLFGEIIN